MLSCPFFSCSFLSLAFYSGAKYLRSSVNKKLGFDRGGGNNDGKRGRERGKKERNSVLRDDRKRWRVAYHVSWLVAAPLSFTLLAYSLTVAVLHTLTIQVQSRGCDIIFKKKEKEEIYSFRLFFFNISTSLPFRYIPCYDKF